jgi:hypothetical protein
MAGFGDLEFMQRGRRLFVGAVMLVVGGVVGYTLPKSNASPSAQTGSVQSVGNISKDAVVAFEFKPSNGPQESFRLQGGTPWQDKPSGRWRSKSLPSCIVPGTTTPAKATLGIITAQGVGSAPGRPIVVWVECYG